MYRFLIVLLFAMPRGVVAQDVAILLHQAAQFESGFKEDEALKKYQEVLRISPNNFVALCQCSDLSCRVGNRQESRDRKVDYFKAGYAYARAAWRVDSANSEVNVVMAFSLARMALIQSGKEKVAAANAIKAYAENAIRYDAQNYKAYHILGRWNYEVSGLNFIERTLARWLFGALPEASLADAITYFEKSMAIKPDFMLNYLELAKACRRDGQKDRAIHLLRHMETLSDGMYDDRQVRSEGRKLLADLTE